MNILVISGGTGNDALVRGIKNIYPESTIQVLVNAYDNGKSTGICRNVTNTLGVSDIRKNHIRMYKAMTEDINECFVEFYESRFDLTKGHEIEEVCSKLSGWDMNYLDVFVKRFFQRPESLNFEYRDFSISNIVYSEMYSYYGYEQTNKFFCNLLGIDDFVILNSFDNVFITATTESGKVIDDEGKIVDYANSCDPIVEIRYDNTPDSCTLNPVALSAIENADLIVISTGTFWASIYPTLQYMSLYRAINNVKCRKIWAVNNEEDKDAYGVGSNKMIEHLDKLGLNLSDFTILQNTDAVDSLKEPNSTFDIVQVPMGNNNGKHNGELFAKAILSLYYNIRDNAFDKIIFDFDDTIWSRNANESHEEMSLSRENVKLLNNLSDVACIVSGNSYESIAKKLSKIYGSSLDGFNVDIWADANSCLFRNNQRNRVIPDLIIKDKIDDLIHFLLNKYNLECSVNDATFPTCLKIKPLTNLERSLLIDYLNNFIFYVGKLENCLAIPAGKTTVDIISKSNNKLAVLHQITDNPKRVLYVGDEIDAGNDKMIAHACGHSIHTSGVEETNAILKLLQRN